MHQEYHAEHDQHLAHYFANPVNRRHLQRAKILERIERTPSFYKHVLTLSQTSTGATTEVCMCTATSVCVLCMCRRRRQAMLADGRELSGSLKILLDEVGLPQPAATATTRPQSAKGGLLGATKEYSYGMSRPASSCGRLYIPSPRPPTAAGTPRPQSATPVPPFPSGRAERETLVPSRPTSAAPPPSCGSPDVDPSSSDVPAAANEVGRRMNRDAKKGRRSASRDASTACSRVAGFSRPHVFIDAMSPEKMKKKWKKQGTTVELLEPQSLFPQTAASSRNEQPIELEELTLDELLAADPKIFTEPLKNRSDSRTSARKSETCATELVETWSSKIRATAGKDENIRVELSNEPADRFTRKSLPAPQTFLLIRFTAQQLAAAIVIQSAFRGHMVRIARHRQLWAAWKIQRNVRKYMDKRRTAVAVWALERHGGRWCPTAKFTHVANHHKLTRPSAVGTGGSGGGVGTAAVPGELSALVSHERDVVRLSAMISLMCSETKERVSLLLVRHDEFTSLVSEWIEVREKAVRLRVFQLEAEGWARLVQRRTMEMRCLSQRKTLLFKHNSLQAGFLREHRLITIAASLEAQVWIESFQRCGITRAANAHSEALIQRHSLIMLNFRRRLIEEGETRLRQDLVEDARQAFISIFKQMVVRLASCFGSSLLAADDKYRKELMAKEIVGRALRVGIQ